MKNYSPQEITEIIASARKDCRTVSSGQIKALCAEIEVLRQRVSDAEQVIEHINSLRDKAYEEIKEELLFAVQLLKLTRPYVAGPETLMLWNKITELIDRHECRPRRCMPLLQRSGRERGRDDEGGDRVTKG